MTTLAVKTVLMLLQSLLIVRAATVTADDSLDSKNVADK